MLRAGRDAQRDIAVYRRHIHLAAQRRVDRAHRHADVDVVALTLEDLMRRDQDLDIQVAVRSAVDAALALSADADLLAALDAGRDLDVQLDALMLIAASAALGAFAADLLTGPAALRTYALLLHDAEHRPRLRRHIAGAVASRAGVDVAGAVCAAAAAFLTLLIHIDVDGLGLAEDRIHEIDAHLHEAVISLAGTVVRPSASAAETAAEEGAKNIIETAEA